jgi:diguanylate cyclase (GGDEF)-like protein
MEAMRLGGPESGIDPVTGALTRAALDRRLPLALAAAERARGRFAVVLFDVDYFKSVNDAYGHARGDEVLRQVADRVRACVRPGEELFRQGGDEFVMLLPHTDRAQALALAERIAGTMAAAPLPGTVPLSVSVSLGVAAYPEDAVTSDSLLEAADRRNYLAKRRGRGSAVADDVDTGDPIASSRLLQRDNALSAVQRYFARLAEVGSGALTVGGQAGSGFTRFLEEVVRIAGLRGYRVIDTAGDPAHPRHLEPVPTGSEQPAPGVLVVHDHGDAAGLRRLVGQLRSADPAPAVIGVVHTSIGAAAGRDDLGVPVLGTVELLPWAPDVLRIWLRTVLQGEPSDRLVGLVHRSSRGLPAKARRELDRLGEQGGLRRAPDGGWDVVGMAVPAARSPYRVPTPLTALIGRENETAEIAELVGRHRLLTLTGPGGVGKTRLSLAAAAAVAHEFPNGVAFVALEDTTDEAGVISAIGRALRMSDTAGKPLFDAIVEHLEERCLLLVLDNFEQALAAAPVLGQLLAAVPDVKALATSRERLRLYGERVFQVGPLPLPDLKRLPDRADDIPELVATSPALGLFRARASAATHRFALTPENLPAAAELCHRLDGLPLAIELAAAHSDVLTPRDMLDGIVNRMDLLADGPLDLPGRQRSLRAAIDWSLDLLGPADRDLFDQLAAFTDGWTSAAAEAVCRIGDDADEPGVARRLAILADKNLLTVTQQPDDTVRYAMLETIRHHAADRLALRSDADDVRLRHALCYAAFAERSSRELAGPDQADWAGRVQRDYPNLRTAFSFAHANGHPTLAGRIAVGLWRYWRNGDYIDEGRAWLAGVLAGDALAGDALAGDALAGDARLPDGLRAHALHAAGLLAATQDDYQSAARLGAESLRLATEIGDAVAGAQAVNLLGFAAMGTGDYDAAHAYFSDSLDRWAGQDNALGMATAYGNLTKVALRLGDTETASKRAAAAVALDRRVGNTRGITLGLECLGQIRLLQRDITGARELLLESLALSRSLGDVFGEAVALHHLGLVAEHEGDRGAAIGRITQALELRYEVGDQEGLAASLERLALLVADDATLAIQLLGATAHIRQRYGLPTPIESTELHAEIARRVDAEMDADAIARTYRHGESVSVAQLVEQLTATAPDARV